jgi:hypothetical protein
MFSSAIDSIQSELTARQKWSNIRLIMAVNESKARLESTQWYKWQMSGARGTMEMARLEGLRTTTIPAQTVEEELGGMHIALTTVGDKHKLGARVSTIFFEDDRERDVFETIIFKLPRPARDRAVEIDNPLLNHLTEARVYSRSAGLRQHARAVEATSLVYGTQKT